MKYIPNTYLYDVNILYYILKLPLPNDAINLILKYYNIYLDINKSKIDFWIKLYIETNNLNLWSRCCSNIINKKYSKFHVAYRLFNIENLFLNLSTDFNNIIKFQYNYKLNMLYFNNTPYNNNIIKNVVKNEKYFKNNMLNIDDINKIYTINKYEPNHELNNITLYEKKYIELFIKRCHLYLKYLEYIQFSNIFSAKIKKIFPIQKNIKKIYSKYRKIILLENIILLK